MQLKSYFRISTPSTSKVPASEVETEYKRLRRQTFWGVTAAYSLYYVCRMTLSVVKQPVIDDGIMTAAQLGLVDSAMLLVYAVGKFCNGFVADYCNIRRFMAWGLIVSAFVNLVLGVLGVVSGVTSTVLFVLFALLWGANGWAQSMGAPPGVISLSRWYPLSRRGTMYSIFSSTPYLGKSLTFIIIGLIVGAVGWQWGFIFASVAGLIGALVVLIFVSDTPESKGLPSVQELSGEEITKTDTKPVRELQKMVLKHPGLWVIALSSAFVYITQYAVSGWGVLFLQKAKSFSLEGATQIIAFSEAFGILGTILAGWLSDTVFKGDRVKPVFLSGIICFLSLAAFLFLKGSYILNIVFVSLFSLSIGMLYCIVAGLMALDLVPRKATGAALGIVGLSSYAAAAIQSVVSGFLIDGNLLSVSASAASAYNFTPVSLFWLAACLLATLLPIVGWRHLAGGARVDK